ncbi:MAG: hypothetical protein ACRDWY_17290, partial [Actinomycetes bacterium]
MSATLDPHKLDTHMLDPHPELRTETESGTLDALVADCAEVVRHLAEVPPARRRVVAIPRQAVDMVSGLGRYG